jgi:hypothetical protein
MIIWDKRQGECILGSCWLSFRCVPMQVNATALRLVRELLGLYTADAMAGVAEHPKRTPKSVDSPLDVLLKVLALQPANAETEKSATSIRQKALGQLSAALYAAVPAESQVKLLLVGLPQLNSTFGFLHR